MRSPAAAVVAVAAVALGPIGLIALADTGGAATGSGAVQDTPSALPRPVIPSGGAGADTPGTSSSVSPARIEAGGVLRYRVSGFPAGEVVYLKIDDGSFCSRSGVHGACVVAQQRIPSSGTVTGSLTVPADLAAGAHWLRYLASEDVVGADGADLGIRGYTNRGDSDFTVVSGPAATGPSAATASPAASPTAASTTATSATTGGLVTATPPPDGEPTGSAGSPASGTDAQGAGGFDVATPGATLTVAPVEALAGPMQPTADLTVAPSPVTAVAPRVTIEPAGSAGHRPVAGLAGLAALLVLSGVLVLRSRRRG